MRSRRLFPYGLSALGVAFGISVFAACGGSGASPAPPPDEGGSGGDGAVDEVGPATDADATAEAAADARTGCGATSSAYPPGTTEAKLTVAGRSRSFLVHVPPGYRADEATPVVLMLHGGGGSGKQLQTQSAEMDPIADRERFITVYPDGTGLVRTWNAGLCCGKAVEDGVDDVAFVAALLDHLEGALCTDRNRVFATGMSNGALLAHRLACELSDRVVAIAPVAGTMGIPECKPTRPVAVMQIHGTLDGHVPWAGGVGCGPSGASFTSVPSTMEGWRVRNGCAATTAPYFTQGDGTCMAQQGCQVPVVLCAIEGGGHSWRGGLPKSAVADCPADGAQSTTFFASEAAWAFFAANPRR